MGKEEANAFLESLLNKTLRVYTTDTRIFVGQLKCTDKVQYIHNNNNNINNCAAPTHISRPNQTRPDQPPYPPPKK